MQTIEERLDSLADLSAGRELINLNKQVEIDKILTPEILNKLDAIDKMFSPSFIAIDHEIAQLSTAIRDAVLHAEKSVKGRCLHAVYMSGRVSWDTAKLEGLMIAIPQLSQLRKIGNPSVTIRKI